jgi:hypothetical protein
MNAPLSPPTVMQMQCVTTLWAVLRVPANQVLLEMVIVVQVLTIPYISFIVSALKIHDKLFFKSCLVYLFKNTSNSLL